MCGAASSSIGRITRNFGLIFKYFKMECHNGAGGAGRLCLSGMARSRRRLIPPVYFNFEVQFHEGLAYPQASVLRFAVAVFESYIIYPAPPDTEILFLVEDAQFVFIGPLLKPAVVGKVFEELNQHKPASKESDNYKSLNHKADIVCWRAVQIKEQTGICTAVVRPIRDLTRD